MHGYAGMFAAVALLLAPIRCGAAPPAELDNAAVSSVEGAASEMMAGIARDLAADGPEAWLRYFVDDASFYMASDGSVVFPNIDAARSFLAEFSPTVAAMHLSWGEVRIEPLSVDIALVSAAYDEVITFADGQETSFGGFFTGTAVHTEAGWKLRNLHWSSPQNDADGDEALRESGARKADGR